MSATKRERLDEVWRRLRLAGPFATGEAVRMALEVVMRDVEDELSGIKENPDAATAPPDGRMYPPHNRFEVASGSSLARTFKQTRHRTSIGSNGSLWVIASNGDVEIDLPGADGRTVADLTSEKAT